MNSHNMKWVWATSNQILIYTHSESTNMLLALHRSLPCMLALLLSLKDVVIKILNDARIEKRHMHACISTRQLNVFFSRSLLSITFQTWLIFHHKTWDVAGTSGIFTLHLIFPSLSSSTGFYIFHFVGCGTIIYFDAWAQRLIKDFGLWSAVQPQNEY